MGLQGFSGSGSDANVWRVEVDGAGTNAAASKALRLTRSPSVPDPVDSTDHELPRNPHLLPTGVIVDAGGPTAAVVPLLGGGSLAHRLAATGPFTGDECLIVVASMRSALTSLHTAGFVHLDVSPANIVLAADGCPVLVDTRNIRHATGQSCRKGTPPYTVPGADASPSTDWLALGRVVTELASGSTLTAATRLPEPLRATVVALLAGQDPVATLRPYSPDDRTITVYPPDYTIAPDQRSTIDFVESVDHREARPHRPHRNRKGWAACATVLALTAAFVSASIGMRNQGPTCPLSTLSSEALLMDYPDATIIEADTGAECPTPVVWLPASGELVVSTSVGPQRFALGEPGDQLFLGDWNCDGTVTPALNRGTRFYIFDDWPQHTPVAAVEIDKAAEVCADPATDRAG